MAKVISIGVENATRKVTRLHVGVGGSNRKVVKGYIGIGGSAKQFYQLTKWNKYNTITKYKWDVYDVITSTTYTPYQYQMYEYWWYPPDDYEATWTWVQSGDIYKDTNIGLYGINWPTDENLQSGYPSVLVYKGGYIATYTDAGFDDPNKMISNGQWGASNNLYRTIYYLGAHGQGMICHTFNASTTTTKGPNFQYNVYDTSSTKYPSNGALNSLWYVQNGTVKDRGSLVGTVESEDASEYPTNGLHSDGYWYVKT